jgi:hypothetical protein
MMSHILRHFSLQAAKWNSTVVLGMTLVWICVLGCVISSILSQPFERKQRIFWVVLVIAVPFLGVLSYLPFAFHKDELPHIFLHKKKRTKRGKDSRPISTEEPHARS